MNHKLSFFAFLVLISTSLMLAACGALAETPSSAPSEGLLLPMSTQQSPSAADCAGCAQATLAALQTQEKSNAEAQAAATAEIMGANAQATLNVVNATVGAAQTEEKNNANIIAAQVAATAAIVRANAEATLAAAGSTQVAAQTQDAIRQTQAQFSMQLTAGLVTQNAIATITQQKNNLLAASTQTVVANLIATQTQSAVATSQWYTDQARQRAEQRQAPLTFLWMWCVPFFIIAIALVCLVFFWRWLKIRETRQLIEMQAEASRLEAGTTPPVIIDHQPRSFNEVVNKNNPDLIPKTTDHVRRWLDEVTHKLIASKKDEDDNPDD